MSIFCLLGSHISGDDVSLEDASKISREDENKCLRCGKELIFYY